MKIGIILSFIILVSSCSSWLEVEPKAKIKADQLFESEQGFMDALIGCYENLSQRSLYGGELTALFIEHLISNYEYRDVSKTAYESVVLHDYTDSECAGYIDDIWSGMYNVICNLNEIIEQVEVNKSKLTYTKYALIKGEAYGLRAFLYTDLVRLFTWGDLANRGDQLMDKLAIPYPKNYDKEVVKQSSLKEVLANIHSDLDVAYELLYSYDPISRTDARPEDYQAPTSSYYSSTVRPYRMNIKGVIATRMRLNLWEGNYTESYKDANYLINTLTTSWVQEGIINSADEAVRDYTFSSEQLFGVETYDRFDSWVQDLYQYKDGTQYNYKGFYITKNTVNSIYEINENVGASDFRYLRWFNKDQSRYVFIKYYEYEDMSYPDQMPLIGKSEVYYTAAECLLHIDNFDSFEGKTGTPMDEAIDLLNEVRTARGIPSSATIPSTISKEDFQNEIFKECRKEYIGYGQMFYYYKRLGMTTIPTIATVISDDIYILPMPDTEVNVGNRIQLLNDN